VSGGAPPPFASHPVLWQAPMSSQGHNLSATTAVAGSSGALI
jgi:hypothetical protein